MGARCKAQRLRHNIDEIASWPDLQCHHTHAADEWQPYLQNGQRVSRRKLSTQHRWRLASQSPLHGGLSAWGWPSSTFPVSPLWRLQAGGNIGFISTFPGTSADEQARTPQRKRVVDVIREDKTLPPGVVYVGRGHHSHRLPVTKWSSPFVPGHNCDPCWLPLYVEHVMQRLAEDLPELTWPATAR